MNYFEVWEYLDKQLLFKPYYMHVMNLNDDNIPFNNAEFLGYLAYLV